MPRPRESTAEVGALCSRGITLLRRSYDPLRLPTQASVGTSASGLISSVSTASIGGPGGVSSLTPLLCPCMLPPSPREPRWVRIPNSSTIDSSLRPTTGGSATPVPALAAITAGYTLTGAHRSFIAIAACRFVSVPGLRTTPHMAEPSRTLCRSCFDGTGCPVAPGPRLLTDLGYL